MKVTRNSSKWWLEEKKEHDLSAIDDLMMKSSTECSLFNCTKLDTPYFFCYTLRKLLVIRERFLHPLLMDTCTRRTHVVLFRYMPRTRQNISRSFANYSKLLFRIKRRAYAVGWISSRVYPLSHTARLIFYRKTPVCRSTLSSRTRTPQGYYMTFPFSVFDDSRRSSQS